MCVHTDDLVSDHCQLPASESQFPDSACQSLTLALAPAPTCEHLTSELLTSRCQFLDTTQGDFNKQKFTLGGVICIEANRVCPSPLPKKTTKIHEILYTRQYC